jgi:hypothetical protein
MSLEEQLLEREAKRLGISVVQLRMKMAVTNSDGSDVMRQVVGDYLSGAMRHLHEPSSIIAKAAEVRTAPKQGWQEPAPLGPPMGVPLMDRMMDQQDAIDRRERQRLFGIEPTDALRRR